PGEGGRGSGRCGLGRSLDFHLDSRMINGLQLLWLLIRRHLISSDQLHILQWSLSLSSRALRRSSFALLHSSFI
ncbi:hypothetical protein PMAYCL1PPCAC_00059, partial [Pristionchus mayeri]